MTTYRFHFRPSGKRGQREGCLFIRVIHKRRHKDIVRPYLIMPDEWDCLSRRVKASSNISKRAYVLQEISSCMKDDISRLDNIVCLLTRKGNYCVNDIIREFTESISRDTLVSSAEVMARELSANGQHRTARAYRSAVRSFTGFTGRDLSLCEISPVLIRQYEQYLLDRGLKMNTVSFYMRNLRAIYYRAVKAGTISGCIKNPFGDVFTGVHETRRRALDREELEKIAGLDKILTKKLSAGRTVKGSSGKERQLKDALNYFMFAFHSRGMSFIDLACLKKTEVSGDTILYKRKKTGYFIEVKITGPMKKIIGYFKSRTKNSPYVFPILGINEVNPRLQYESGLTKQNRLLKELASMSGIGKNLSTHVARHSWATLAKRMGYPIPLISEGLGHRDIKVTSTYLASFEKSALDELSNRLSKVISAA